ncbi:MAG TPA: type II toxin-antitoxin system VapC family toxin [Alphaproteobacteria bacterium]|nr:type II toxin-antitoxin system VapC family toxin [Alphaproteobacteria bacterium]
MSWLLDTNVISELAQARRNPGFQTWWDQNKQTQGKLFLCAPVIAEIERWARLPKLIAHRRRAILDWLDHEVLPTFGERILAFDAEVARTWGVMTAAMPKNATLPIVNSYIAAIAIHHDLTLVTRNVEEMKVFPEIKLHSPWS